MMVVIILLLHLAGAVFEENYGNFHNAITSTVSTPAVSDVMVYIVFGLLSVLKVRCHSLCGLGGSPSFWPEITYQY